MRCTDDHGNVCVHLVEHPDNISKFFADSNFNDKHRDPYFWLATTLIGMNIVDTWKLADHPKLLNPPGTREDTTKVTIKKILECYVINLSLTLLHSF
jgi:hypothetical protein